MNIRKDAKVRYLNANCQQTLLFPSAKILSAISQRCHSHIEEKSNVPTTKKDISNRPNNAMRKHYRKVWCINTLN